MLGDYIPLYIKKRKTICIRYNDLTRESDRVHKMDNKIKSWKE